MSSKIIGKYQKYKTKYHATAGLSKIEYFDSILNNTEVTLSDLNILYENVDSVNDRKNIISYLVNKKNSMDDNTPLYITLVNFLRYYGYIDTGKNVVTKTDDIGTMAKYIINHIDNIPKCHQHINLLNDKTKSSVLEYLRTNHNLTYVQLIENITRFIKIESIGLPGWPRPM